MARRLSVRRKALKRSAAAVPSGRPAKRRVRIKPAVGRRRVRVKRSRAGRVRASSKRSTQAAEITWLKSRAGTKRRRPLMGWRLAKATTFFAKQRFQNVAPMDRGPDRGALFLGTMLTTANTVTSNIDAANYFVNTESPLATNLTYTHIRLPFHMYCLNGSFFANTHGVGTVNYSQALQPFLAKDMTVSFASFRGMWSNGTSVADNMFVNETDNGLAATSDRQRYEQMCWYDIKLALRNAKESATWFDIMIISFKDDHLDPYVTPTAADQLADRVAFYSQMGSNGAIHPLCNNDPNLSKVMKRVNIHKRMRVVMDKQQTTDADASPDTKLVRIFYRDGGLYDMMWNATADAGGAGDQAWSSIVNQSQYKQQTVQEAQPYPKPRARKYLIIRAFSTLTWGTSGAGGTAATVSAIDANKCPSYDIILRRKVVCAA